MKKVFKKLYKLLPFKQQIFGVVKSVIKVPHRIYRHLYFNGRISYTVNGQKIIMNQQGYDVENTLFWAGLEGCWEKESMGLWVRLCTQARNIMDVGANTGTYALVAKTINPQAAVYAFEPLDFIYTKLADNVQLNKLGIHCVQEALSNYDGVAKVYPETLEHIYSITVNKNTSAAEVQVHEKEIRVTKFSTFVAQHAVQGADLMKIDVEMHEAEVLEGMGDYLREWKPTMLIEILSDEVGQKVETLINGMGYLFFNINENGGIRKVEHIGKSDYYNYLLCSAESASFLKLI
jgi:FkbM family methyltransferase